MAIAAGVLSVATWLYLLLGRGWFWRVDKCSTWNNCGKAQNGNEVTVVAVVPARNESATIGRCVASLFGQKFAGTLRVIVVDDESDDGTAEAARAAARNTHPVAANAAATRVGHPPAPGETRVGQPADRLTVITGQPLPPGWSGKVWAMQQGIEAARALQPNFLLLTDADVVHAPDSLATLVTIAQNGPFQLASFMVRLHCEDMAERLLIPVFVFFFFMLYPPRWIADARKATAGAAGGCILLRPEALERAGGMAAIRDEVIDDCALARLIKRSSMQNVPSAAEAAPLQSLQPAVSQVDRGTRGRVWLGLSQDTASVRPYGSLREIGRMIARSAFNQLHHSALLLAGALAGMVIMFVVPVALVFDPTLAKTGLGWATLKTGLGWATVVGTLLGAVAWALMTLMYAPMVRFYRLNPLWAATLPASACFYMGATVWSAVKYWSGRGGEWKGRVQDVKE